jgi:site-specific DNA recombinase
MALRFAPIIRVSTEKQAQKGESLNTQKIQIKQFVDLLKGTIPDHCWQYSGQEHATPNQERALLDKLLADSSKNLFDAVIVCDHDRWSRDNKKSKEGLEILRKNGIRFFVGTSERDLNDPTDMFIVAMFAEVGELHARDQAKRSIDNRIARAKKGIPASGRLPYGRTYWDKERKIGKWGIDDKKQSQISDAAKRYLDGVPNRENAKLTGLNWPFLWKTLTHNCGDKWEEHYKGERIVHTVPPLLPEETIAEILRRAKLNKVNHNPNANKFLLTSFIFCGCGCSYRLVPQTNHGTKRYYRHQNDLEKACKLKSWIPADEIEDATVIALVRMFGDPQIIIEAIERNIPNREKLKQLKAEHYTLIKQDKQDIDARNRVVNKVMAGLFSDDEVKSEMDKLREKRAARDRRLAIIAAELESVPDEVKIKQLSTRSLKMKLAVLANASKQQKPESILKKPYAWKRKLVEDCFAAKSLQEKLLGVSVMKTPSGRWTFEIRGILEKVLTGALLCDKFSDDYELGFDDTPAKYASSLRGPDLRGPRSP